MYTAFAQFYDVFMNVDYAKRAVYFDALLQQYGVQKGILLDLGCGTGNLSFEMEKCGYDVIGTDISEEMLDEALAKKQQNQSSVLFLKQDMCKIDLYGTIQSCVCSLDCINHLESIEKVNRTFQRVGLFTEPGGVFIFDVNTAYKHRNVLANNAYIFENESCFLAWQNECMEDDSVRIDLDFFEADESGVYTRTGESFTEYFYNDAQLTHALEQGGFQLCAVLEDMAFEAPGEKSERKIFVAKKV